MRYSVFIILGLLFASFSCEKEELETFVQQEILFARIDKSNTWDESVQGWLIDNSGKIKGFSLNRNPGLEWKSFTESGFNSSEEIYHNLMQTDTTFSQLSQGDLFKYYQLIEPASRGCLAEKNNISSTAVQKSYFAIQFFPEEKKYRWVLLGSRGELDINNTSREAEKLYDWLKEVDHLALNAGQPE